jgi:hypothetical protein
MNKTKNQMMGDQLATFKRRAKLRVLRHKNLPYAINSYMVGNSFGQVIGGNIAYFMFNNEQNRVSYPKVFKSQIRANEHIQLNLNANEIVDKFIEDGVKEIQEQYK